MTTALLTVFGAYALWLAAGALAVVRAASERRRMAGTALPVFGVLAALTSWMRNEMDFLGSHLSFPLSLLGWLALALVCGVAGLLCLRVWPGAAWALLGPPALLLLLWFT